MYLCIHVHLKPSCTHTYTHKHTKTHFLSNGSSRYPQCIENECSSITYTFITQTDRQRDRHKDLLSLQRVKQVPPSHRNRRFIHPCTHLHTHTHTHTHSLSLSILSHTDLLSLKRVKQVPPSHRKRVFVHHISAPSDVHKYVVKQRQGHVDGHDDDRGGKHLCVCTCVYVCVCMYVWVCVCIGMMMTAVVNT
jgi:hypothetical protein